MLAGMHVAAFEVVFSQHNIKPKPYYKGYYIKNKLSCQHQDLRDAEPWFDRVRAAVAFCIHTDRAVTAVVQLLQAGSLLSRTQTNTACNRLGRA
jgi:hypothetical protein